MTRLAACLAVLSAALCLVPAAAFAAGPRPAGDARHSGAIPPCDGTATQDHFDCFTINTVDGSGEVPFNNSVSTSTGATPFSSAAFTLREDGELNGCGGLGTGGAGVSWGGKTSWMRFLTSVKGTATVTAVADFDTILAVYDSANAAYGAIGFGDLTNLDCTDDLASGATDEVLTVPVTANKPLHIQTLGYCTTAGLAPNTSSTSSAHCDAAPFDNVASGTHTHFDTTPPTASGANRLTVVFTADDADSDGVPDTRDSCPSQSGPASNNGCPVPAPPPAPAPPPVAPPPPPPPVAPPPPPPPPPVRELRPVNATLTAGRTRNGIKVISLVVSAPRRSRIEVRCSRGCSRQVLTAAAEVTASRKVPFRRLRNKVLRSGTRLRIYVTKSGYIGKYFQYNIGKGTFRKIERCLKPGSRVPRTRC